MQPVLHFVVNNQIITRTDTFVPVRNSRNYLYAEFEFKTEDWAGVSKIALFHNEGNEQISILLGETDTCLIPAEVLIGSSFTVSVIAGDVITANAVTVKLYESGYRQGVEEADEATNVLEYGLRKYCDVDDIEMRRG